MNINSNAKRILIYGDSITWGRIANIQDRYDLNTRFTGVLQKNLGMDYEVIEEGLRGRMASGENPYQTDKDGWKQFTPIYLSHLPIHMLIIFLGTNDTNDKSEKNSEMIARDIELYIEKAKSLSKANETVEPIIVIVSAPKIDESVLKANTMFSGAGTRMEKLPQYLANIAEKNQCHFFDTNNHTKVCKEDGVHLDKDNNIKLGEKLTSFIIDIFNK